MYITLNLVHKYWTSLNSMAMHSNIALQWVREYVICTGNIIADGLAKYVLHLTAEHTYPFCEILFSASKLRIDIFPINKEQQLWNDAYLPTNQNYMSYLRLKTALKTKTQETKCSDIRTLQLHHSYLIQIQNSLPQEAKSRTLQLRHSNFKNGNPILYKVSKYRHIRIKILHYMSMICI